jgi:hypothetical protein
MKIVRLWTLAAITSLCGCASMNAMRAQHSWRGRCYASLDRDVTFVAGDAAEDCGLLPLGADRYEQSRIAHCVEQAVERGSAFKAGYESVGDDSAYCDVVARAADGTYWSLYVDSDVTGQWATKGDHSAMSVSRCNGLEFRPGTIGAGSFFKTTGCAPSPDEVKAIIAHRADR